MLASEESVLSSLKEYEEILKSIQTDQKKVIQLVGQLKKSDSKEEREKRIEKIINRLADALLVNSVSVNFEEHYLSIDGHQALTKVVQVINNLINPSDSINYKRSKEGFLHIVKNLVLSTSENIPDTTVSFEDLVAEIEKLPADLQTKTFAHEREVSPLKQEKSAAVENWGEEEPEVEEDKHEQQEVQAEEEPQEFSEEKPNAQFHKPGNVA